MTSHFEQVQRVLADATPLQLSLVGAAVLSAGYFILSGSSSRKYPPGPPRLPIIGNSHNFPNNNWPVVFNEWQKKYGDIVYLDLPRMPFVVVNSLSVANELFIRRTNVNSDRKIGYMVHHMMGMEWFMPHINPNGVFYKQRKVLKQGLGPTAVMRHDALIEHCANSLVLKLQSIHGNPEETVVKTVSLAIIELAYGQKMAEDNGEQLIKQNQEAMSMIFHAFHHVWMVDFFPWLRFIPSWMPGAGFKRFAKKTKDILHNLRSEPFNLAVQRHKEGTLDHCLAREWITEFGPCEEAQDALAALYFAGHDTTSTAVVRFLHAMFIFPDVAKRVQAEIDRVTGQDRLPAIKDRQSLPYTEAVWKETLRWRPHMPLALPHTNSEDQIINGYFIPKGAVIHPNYGFMMTDPSIWRDPDVFRPERFLDADTSKLIDIAFGFGSRICPGMYFADRAVFHIALTTMALFDILPLEGEKVPHVNDIEYTKDTTKVPVKFDCRFVLRNEEASNLLASLALNTAR